MNFSLIELESTANHHCRVLPENKFVMKMANKDVMKTENSNA